MERALLIVLSALAVALVMLHGCTGTQPQNGTQGPPVMSNGTPPSPVNPAGLTKEQCEQARGQWNDCGSACRGAPQGTACIEVCVAYCECGGIAGFQCPAGYTCSDYLPKDKDGNPVPDAMGVCKRG